MLKEISPIIYEGANITGGEGGATNLICIRHCLNHEIVEVDKNTAIVIKDNSYQRIYLNDHHEIGVQVFLGGTNNPNIAPGQIKDVKVGSHIIKIVGTDSKGVIFNGKKPLKYNPQLDRQLYANIR